MSIKNRLKKLENVLVDDSSFCGCSPSGRCEFYFQDLSEDAKSNEPVIHGEAVPDICPKCRKPIEKQQIVMRFVDHSTKTRFPNKWKS